MLAPARNVKSLPERSGALVAARLQRLGADRHLIDFELEAMGDVRVGGTQDRSIRRFQKNKHSASSRRGFHVDKPLG